MGNEANTKRMSMIVTKGSLDWAYPPFILATTAAAMGLEVTMFFTFYGLTLLKKKLDLKINIIAIAQGSSELSISFAVRAADMKEAVKAIHEEFKL